MDTDNKPNTQSDYKEIEKLWEEIKLLTEEIKQLYKLVEQNNNRIL